MSWGTDFANAFVAGYSIAPSKLDDDRKQAEIDSANASTADTKAKTAALPAQIAYEKSQTDKNSAQSDLYIKQGDAAERRADAAERMADGKYPDGQDWSDSDADFGALFGVTPQTTVPVASPTNTSGGNSAPTDVSGDPGSSNGASNSGPSPAPASAIPMAPPGGGTDTQVASASPSSGVPVPPQTIPNSPVAPGGDLSKLFSSADQALGTNGYAQTVAAIETGGTYDTAAQNPKSSAKGLFQFTDQTAKGLGLGDPNDPVASTKAFVDLTKQAQIKLGSTLGRPPTQPELYLAHQQGASGAAALLANPGANAVDTLTALYAKTGVEDPKGRATDAVTNNGGSADMTSGQFSQLWTDKYNSYAAQNAGSGDGAMKPLPAPAPLTPDSMSPLASAPPAKIDGDHLSAAIKAGSADLSDKALGGALRTTDDQSKAVDAYHNGAGAMPAGMFSQILKKVDPEGKYPVGTQAAIAISQIMETPDMSATQKAHYVGQLLQTTRLGFNQYAAIANEAGKSGKVSDALQAAAHAYNMIPTGKTVTAVNLDSSSGAYTLAIRDDKTGAMSNEPLMSPSDVAAGKLHIMPQMFDQMLADTVSAGGPADKTALPAHDQAAIADLSNDGHFRGDVYASLGEKGRAAYQSAYEDMNKEGSNSSDASASVDTTMGVIKTALTAPNMNVGSTNDALAKNETELKTNLTKWFRNDDKADPQIAGQTIANVLLPTAFSSGAYSVKEGKDSATITNSKDGSSVDVPMPVWKNIQQVRATVQNAELKSLRDGRAYPADAVGPDERKAHSMSFGDAQRAGALQSNSRQAQAIPTGPAPVAAPPPKVGIPVFADPYSAARPASRVSRDY